MNPTRTLTGPESIGIPGNAEREHKELTTFDDMDPNQQQALVQSKIDQYMAHQLVAPIFEKLTQHLPQSLTYHCVAHSENVLREVVLFATLDQRTEREIELLALTAAYHDAGFIVQINDNEPIGAEMLAQALLQDGSYSSGEISLVQTMILDTKLVDGANGPIQLPSTELSKYLLDADLGNLGRDDFFDKLELLITEKRADRVEEIRKTITLMTGHHWYTDIAHSLRQAKKLENLEILKRELEQLQSGSG